ncbi:putative nuclease of restriction endonuclease-like (RecB) superfamily [Pedobacter sp. UYP30]|uniref:PDDEXK nuclease domain-containing protein n=1 Tax=Pedobacter sp. UYP30 TaxID=1756400 RepID=UPI003390C7C7
MNNTLGNLDFDNILALIISARTRVYAKANAELVLLYFNVGKIVSEKVDAGSWGEATVKELALYIAEKQPLLKGFNRRGLYRMKQFYEANNNPELGILLENTHKKQIVSAVLTQLQNTDNELNKFVSAVLTQINWTNHLLILSKTKSAEEKLFYIYQSIQEKLSTRELERQLNTATFERTMLGEKMSSAVTKQFPEGIFKDLYIFEFLSLPEVHSEDDLQQALIKNLKNFILEMVKGFAYMGSEYRLQIGNKDYYTDLLFYHCDLQCMVLFELKIEEFKPEFLGKLNFYLEALDRDVKRIHENPSIGILLCKSKDVEVVEYALARNVSQALIADYETKLIDKKLLVTKLQELTEQFYRNEE